MKRSLKFLIPGLALLLFSGADVERAFAGPDEDDPFAWLDGPVNCDEIKTEVGVRYHIKFGKPEQLTPVLLEEFKHISDETCENARYSSCRFNWCPDGAPNALTAGLPPPVAVPEAPVPAQPAPVQEVRDVSPQPTDTPGQALAALPTPVPAPIVPAPVEQAAPPEAPAVHAATTSQIAESPAPQSAEAIQLAQAKLDELVKRYSESQKRSISEEQKREKAQNIDWLVVKVPGSDHLPTAKPIRVSSEPPSEETPETAKSGNSRAFAPGLGARRNKSSQTELPPESDRGKVGNPYISGKLLTTPN